MNSIHIEIFCYKGKIHESSFNLSILPRGGIPERLHSEELYGYSLSPTSHSEHCCYMPSDLEARILRVFESGNIEAHISYGRVRIDASDFRRV